MSFVSGYRYSRWGKNCSSRSEKCDRSG